jgi:hypothetical protein
VSARAERPDQDIRAPVFAGREQRQPAAVAAQDGTPTTGRRSSDAANAILTPPAPRRQHRG